MNLARYSLAGTGTSTASLAIMGAPSGSVEQWNGTNWTNENNVNTERSNASANGTTTSAVVYGGNNTEGVGGQTEEWVPDGAISENIE